MAGTKPNWGAGLQTLGALLMQYAQKQEMERRRAEERQQELADLDARYQQELALIQERDRLSGARDEAQRTWESDEKAKEREYVSPRDQAYIDYLGRMPRDGGGGGGDGEQLVTINLPPEVVKAGGPKTITTTPSKAAELVMQLYGPQKPAAGATAGQSLEAALNLEGIAGPDAYATWQGAGILPQVQAAFGDSLAVGRNPVSSIYNLRQQVNEGLAGIPVPAEEPSRWRAFIGAQPTPAGTLLERIEALPRDKDGKIKVDAIRKAGRPYRAKLDEIVPGIAVENKKRAIQKETIPDY